MQLIAPDILAETRGLSVAACITGLLIGLVLWLAGWWGHRFWIVLAATLAAGIYGLCTGPELGMQRLVAGLLLAVAAGALALSLVRVLAFAASGLAAWLVVRQLAPGWDDLQGQIICLLSGGLAGLLLFRFWMMALTSLTGTLLMAYAGLCLGDQLGKLDAVAWSEQNTLLLNGGCGAVALLGFLLQLYLDRRRRRRRRDDDEDAEWFGGQFDRRSRRLPLWDFRGRRAG